MISRRVVALCLSIASVLSASRARADEARLDYVATGAECPSEAQLRDAVAMRLGYDPFTTDAPRLVIVRIDARASGVVGSMQMLDAAGQPLGRRDLEDTGSCADLADVLVLAVSIAIDPERALGVPPPTTETTPAEPPIDTPAESAPQQDVETSPVDPWRLGVGVSLYGQAGFAPSPTAGASVDVRVRHGLWSVGLAGFAELPTGADVGGGRVASYRAGVTLVPCLHVDFFSGCAIVQLGALAAHGERIAMAREATAIMLALGARAQIGWTLAELVTISGFVDLLATPTPTALVLDGRTVWSTGIVAGVIGVSASFETSVGP